MGVSTDAILIYGILLSDFEDQPYSALPFSESDDEDFEDTLARLQVAPVYPEEGCWDDKRAAVAACPLMLVEHCSYEFPMWVLGIRDSHKEARRGYPETFQELNSISSESLAVLKEWCERYNIKFEPQWVLCSMWC